jgi:hypothetical protein
MIIIYNYEGNVAVLDPKPGYKGLFEGTEEERLLYIANAELPNGTKFEVSPFDTVDMEDRTVGTDWVYKGTGRERTSVALSDADQISHKSRIDTYVIARGFPA